MGRAIKWEMGAKRHIRPVLIRPAWRDEIELDELLGEWRRHCVGMHRLEITAALEPHLIDNCAMCQEILTRWECAIEYLTGI